MGRKEKERIRVRIHDIVNVPLANLSASVLALQRRPEPLDATEALNIVEEASFILLRAEEAMTAGASDAFRACLRLLTDGATFSDDTRSALAAHFTNTPALLPTVDTLFRVLIVEDRAFGLFSDEAAELLEFVSLLFDSDALRDRCGVMFLGGLQRALTRCVATDDALRRFTPARQIAAALIESTRGSVANKKKLSNLRFIADAAALSVDVYFQIQCVELLFRLARKAPQLLRGCADPLPASVLDAIPQLPADASMIPRIREIIGAYNASRGGDKLVTLNATHFCIGSRVIAESGVQAYFTPAFFVVLLPTGAADNVPLAYDRIRSIKVLGGRTVSVNLDNAALLLDSVALAAGGGGAASPNGRPSGGVAATESSLSFELDGGQLAVFRASGIHGWISAVLKEKAARLRAAAAPPQDTGAGAKTAAAAAAAQTPAAPEAPAPKTGTSPVSDGSGGGRRRGRAAAAKNEDESDAPLPLPPPAPVRGDVVTMQPTVLFLDTDSSSKKAGGGRGSKGKKGAAAAAAAAVTPAAATAADALLSAVSETLVGEDESATGAAAPQHAADADAGKRQRGKGARTDSAAPSIVNPFSPPQLQKNELPAAAAAAAAAAPPRTPAQTPAASAAAASSLLVPAAHSPAVSRTIDAVMRGSDDRIDGVLEQLKRLVEDKVERKRAEVVAILNSVMQDVQALVDDARAASAAELQTFATTARAAIDAIERDADGVGEEVAAALNDLNAALLRVRGAATAIKEQIACFELDAAQVVETLRAEDAALARQQRAALEDGLVALERHFGANALEEADPVKLLAGFIGRKLDEELRSF